MMSMIARQFGRPRGLLGRLVGRGMSRFNAGHNRWLVRQASEQCAAGLGRVVELGPGPGIGLDEILKSFPSARVWGIDLSPEMLAQARRRNRAAVETGRLALMKGGVEVLQQLAPIDLVVAVHVLYFWHQPLEELATIRRALRPGGWLALGYQLRPNMPPTAQKNFPKEGHRLYETNVEVSALLEQAGFNEVRIMVMGRPDAPEGLLALAIA